MISSRGTSSSVPSATRRSLIRDESDSRISRSAMLRRATALYMRTGTFNSPKLIEPDQIALAMAGIVPTSAKDANPPTGSAEMLRFLDSVYDPAAAPHADRDDPRLQRPRARRAVPQ